MKEINREDLVYVEEIKSGINLFISSKEYVLIVEKKVFLSELSIFKKIEKYDLKGVVNVLGYALTENEEEALLYMEYIKGETLGTYLEDSKKNIVTFILMMKLFINILEIVGEFHKKGIIHKDLKPDNIIVDLNSDNIITIIDFDNARICKGSKSRDTKLVGTERYASPEHYGFEETDSRSDIYSLGFILEDIIRSYKIERYEIFKELIEIKGIAISIDKKLRFQSCEEFKIKLKEKLYILKKNDDMYLSYLLSERQLKENEEVLRIKGENKNYIYILKKIIKEKNFLLYMGYLKESIFKKIRMAYDRMELIKPPKKSFIIETCIFASIVLLYLNTLATEGKLKFSVFLQSLILSLIFLPLFIRMFFLIYRISRYFKYYSIKKRIFKEILYILIGVIFVIISISLINFFKL